MWFSLLFLFLTHGQTPPSTQSASLEAMAKSVLPEPLRSMEEYRRRLRNGHLEIRVYNSFVKHNGAKARRYAYRWVGDDYVCTYLGNDAGVIHMNDDGTPRQVTYTYPGPTTYLMQPGNKYWAHTEHNTSAFVYIKGPPPLSGSDPRAIGVACSQARDGLGLQEIVEKSGAVNAHARTFESRSVGELVEVVARRDDGWNETNVLDPKRGWNPVRVMATHEQRKLTEGCRVELKQYGETWFPQVVRYFNTADENALPYCTIEVTQAVFNENSAPEKLLPKHIGIEAGSQIFVVEDVWKGSPPASIGDEPMGWDGEQLVPFKDLNKRVMSGELKAGPNLLAELDRRRNQPRVYDTGSNPPAPPTTTGPQDSAHTAAKSLRIDVWDQYVDGVAKICEFETIQKNSAQGILRDVRQKAIGKDAKRIEIYFEELRARIDQLLTPEQRSRDADGLERARLAQRATSMPVSTQPSNLGKRNG